MANYLDGDHDKLEVVSRTAWPESSYGDLYNYAGVTDEQAQSVLRLCHQSSVAWCESVGVYFLPTQVRQLHFVDADQISGLTITGGPFLGLVGIQIKRPGTNRWDTVEKDTYTVEETIDRPWLVPNSGTFSSGEALRVNYNVGFGEDISSIPPNILLGTYMHAINQYENRGGYATVPQSLELAISEWRSLY